MVVNLSLQLTPTQWYVIISTIWCIILTVNGVLLLFIELLKENAFIILLVIRSYELLIFKQVFINLEKHQNMWHPCDIFYTL